MAEHGRRSPTPRGVVAIVVGVVLSALLVLPWKRGTPEPLVLGVMPAPLFFWILWTALFIAYIGWLCYGWDPYRGVVRRNAPDRSGPETRTDRGGDA